MAFCDNFGLAFYKGRNVFVTGHTGFKGSWLCRMLALQGARVTGYALDPPTDPSLFKMVGIEKCITSVKYPSLCISLGL